MKLTGRKTLDIFDRYDIVSDRDLAGGVAKLATFLQAAGGSRWAKGTSEGQSGHWPRRNGAGADRAWWSDWSSKSRTPRDSPTLRRTHRYN